MLEEPKGKKKSPRSVPNQRSPSLVRTISLIVSKEGSTGIGSQAEREQTYKSDSEIYKDSYLEE